MQQRKFEVHTPFRFEAVDPGTKTAREWATYATSLASFPDSCESTTFFDLTRVTNDNTMIDGMIS